LNILFKPFGLLAPKDFYIICQSVDYAYVRMV